MYYKLGKVEMVDRFYKYAKELQNDSGGFYGSYGYSTLNKFTQYLSHRRLYFTEGEISWAVKFFLDATYLYRKAALDFEKRKD